MNKNNKTDVVISVVVLILTAAAFVIAISGCRQPNSVATPGPTLAFKVGDNVQTTLPGNRISGRVVEVFKSWGTRAYYRVKYVDDRLHVVIVEFNDSELRKISPWK